MSEIEWYVIEAADEPRIDIRARRSFSGGYIAMCRWRITETESRDPFVLKWLAKGMLYAQRDIDAYPDNILFVSKPGATYVVTP